MKPEIHIPESAKEHKHQLNWNWRREMYECQTCPVTFSGKWVLPYNNPKLLIKLIKQLLGKDDES